MKVRAEVFSPSGEGISVRIVDRATLTEAEDELFDWFNSEFSVGCSCAVDLLGGDDSAVEQLHDWCL